MIIDILKREQLTSSIQNQITALFDQLSPGKTQLALDVLLGAENPATIVYCQDKQQIIGVALMCNYKVISGYKAWIEDVVVDKASRGKGIGRKLIEKLLEEARLKKITQVLLFTEDHRLPAIKLYQNLGFKLKESRIYVYNTKTISE